MASLGVTRVLAVTVVMTVITWLDRAMKKILFLKAVMAEKRECTKFIDVAPGDSAVVVIECNDLMVLG